MDPIKIEVPTTYTITKERIQDLLIGALEGGSDYWCEARFVKAPGCIASYMEYPWIDGCQIIMNDFEGTDMLGGGQYKELTKDVLELGLRRMAGKYPVHFKNFVEENDDAETADVFLQCCCFGEVIFG
jgi:hypothetical protein